MRHHSMPLPASRGFRAASPALSTAAAMAALFALFACARTAEHTGPVAIVADSKNAIVLMPALPVWTLKDSTPVATSEAIPVGEKVAIVGSGQKAMQNGKEREFLPVRRQSGTEGWVRSDMIVSRAILSVVISDNAIIYSAAANSAATTESIPRMTVLVVHSDTGGMPFIRVSGYDASSKTMLRNVILRNEGVSARPSDVQAAILLQLAAGSRNARQQKAFLSTALTDFPDSIFAPEVQAALSALESPPPAPSPPAPEPTPPGGSSPGQ